MRLPNRRTIVYFDGRWLSPLRSLHVINHSPDGFEWGYGGSGPAQLALAICLEILPKDKALETYQEFKRLWIASRPDRNEFELPISKVKGWLEAEAAGLMRTVHDADCPKCKFPETVIIREKATMKAIAEECSKGCGWSRSFEKKS